MLFNFIVEGGFFFNGFVLILMIMLFVNFVFLGIELIGIVVGESVDFDKMILKVIKIMVWCFLFFFVGMIFVLLGLILI